MDTIKEIKDALRMVFFDKKYVFIALLSFLLMFFLYVAIPVFVTPGNSVNLYVSVTGVGGILIIALLAALMGMLIAMQYYILENTRSADKKELSSGIGAFFASIISGIFASATCAACIGVILSFIGTSGIFFLLDHRWELMLLGFGMVLISIYLTARRINNHCEACANVTGEVYIGK